MPQPIKLTYAEVVEAGRKAYLAGELSAQGPAPRAKYRDSVGRPCVIGAALTDNVAAQFDGRFGSYAAVAELVYDGLLEADDVNAMSALQNAHDVWAEAARCGDTQGADQAETRLRKLLNIEEAA